MRDGGHRVASVVDIGADGLVMNEDLIGEGVATVGEPLERGLLDVTD